MGVPTWMYKVGNFGRPESRIFDSDEVEALEKQGWVDSPAKLAKPDAKKPPARKKRRVSALAD